MAVDQLVEPGLAQPVDQVLLNLAPNGFYRTVAVEDTQLIITNALIQQDWAINGLDDIQQCDFFRLARQRNTATRPSRGVQQTGNRELGDDLGQE